MIRRVVVPAVLLAQAVSAQFSGLGSTAGGSSVYFASTLRLKNRAQPLNSKIYAATTADGVSLFRARERSGPPVTAPPCTVNGFADYQGAETSSTGAVALLYFAGADLLYLARLGAYVALAEDESHPKETPEHVFPAEPLPPSNIAPATQPA